MARKVWFKRQEAQGAHRDWEELEAGREDPIVLLSLKNLGKGRRADWFGSRRGYPCWVEPETQPSLEAPPAPLRPRSQQVPQEGSSGWGGGWGTLRAVNKVCSALAAQGSFLLLLKDLPGCSVKPGTQ